MGAFVATALRVRILAIVTSDGGRLPTGDNPSLTGSVGGSVGSIRALVLACHPQPTAAVTVLSTVLAVASGRDARGCVLVACTVLTGQLSIGWSNDVLDVHRDRTTHRSDKPVATGEVTSRAVTLAAVSALVLCVPLSLANGLQAGTAHLVGVGGGWAYNLGLKRTWVSWLPYAVSFGLLPAFVVLGLPGAPAPPLWLVAAGSCLGVAAHMFNVLPDLDDDRATGVRSLPVLLGSTGARVVGCLLLVAVAVLLTFGPPGRPGAAGLFGLVLAAGLAVVAATAGRTAGSRLPFLLVILAAAVDLVLLVAAGAIWS
jgi:4-hydroxybenzoate polyprenyltransferase